MVWKMNGKCQLERLLQWFRPERMSREERGRRDTWERVVVTVVMTMVWCFCYFWGDGGGGGDCGIGEFGDCVVVDKYW